MILLSCVLLIAVISFAVMALMQVRRTRLAKRDAQKLNMRFSPEDPFDIPHRYGDSVLVTSGHSPWATNVTYGRVAGRRVRAFDFRYEVGHGTRRMTRHYAVVVIETDYQLPHLLMWHDADAQFSPVQVRTSDGHIGYWEYCGDSELAETLSDVCKTTGSEVISLQTCGKGLMVFEPVGKRRKRSAKLLQHALSVAAAIYPDASEQVPLDAD